ncbi:MAG TPA: PadR family transcriptional regulator [Chloroflexi bacterium]|nr:PadR family transcriptional regulator [Chloroflexota bacterium]
MDRKLLLLGLLRMQEMHGYQLNNYLDAFLAFCLDVKKPTAYYLLNKMHEDGWIAVEEQQEGNRPVRRIYSLTPEGEQAYQNLLRENLGSYAPVQFDSDIGLAFMDSLPESERNLLLAQRRAQLAQKLTEIEAVPEHPGNFQWMIEHQIRHLRAELAWLDEIITRFA